MVPSWADQLLPQLLMEQFDTLNLDNFSLIGLLYISLRAGQLDWIFFFNRSSRKISFVPDDSITI